MTDTDKRKGSNFIRDIIKADLEAGKYPDGLHFRFPPEPSGYLHIGHAKAICINFGLAEEFGAPCNLRFDDTNPLKEKGEFERAIKDDIHWLGFDWGDRLYHASDYFEKLYEFAIKLIRKGKAYVCDLSPDEIRETRGTLTEPGKESPYRNRSAEENLDLFERMRQGEFPDGSRVLRAKIDMAHGNMNMRDPVMYRIKRAAHHRLGDKWLIYPSYDFTHGQSDSIERVTHSLCNTEFEDHRPLYDWFIRELEIFPSRQIEFASFNLTYTVLSKRNLRRMVEEGIVSGYDDPRLFTFRGLARRGIMPESIRRMMELAGVAKRAGMVEVEFFEHCVREDLNKAAPRFMAVLNPLKVVIENYPDDLVEEMEAVNNPEDPDAGTRSVPFSKVLYLERDDFMIDPPKKFYRLAPGREVRLRYAYFVKCVDYAADEKTGAVTELRCVYDPETKGGNAPDGRKVKATLHWVSAAHAIEGEVRLYEKLFTKENPFEVDEGGDWTDNLNPDSLKVLTDCKLEPNLKNPEPGFRCQFERMGYFCADPDGEPDKPVFNRTVTLKDEWARIQKRKK